MVSQTYTSIVITCYFATFVGLPMEEAVKGILEKDGRLIPPQGWSCPRSQVGGAACPPCSLNSEATAGFGCCL